MSDGKEKIELKSEEFQEVLGEVPPWILRRGIVVIGIAVTIIIIGSTIFKYPDIISSQMTLTRTVPPAGIVAKASGKLEHLYITDKQLVNKGDYLAVIENTVNTEDVLYLKKYLLDLNITFDTVTSMPPKNVHLGSIQTMYSSFYILLFDYLEFHRLNYHSDKITLMKARIARNEKYYRNVYTQKSIAEKQYNLIKRQYSRDSILCDQELITLEDFERKQSELLQGELTLNNITATLENLQIQIAQLQESLLDTEYQYIEKKNSLETQLKTYITQLLAEIETWEMNYILQSPIDGNVTFTKYWVENQNLTSGEVIFNIIPVAKTELIGKALLPITRSGKVKIGQSVNIRFNNFPENEFGIVKGIVRNISLIPAKDENENCYVLDIALTHNLKTTYNKELPYMPEMQAQADIITDDLSLLERFILPIKKVLTESL